MASKSEIILRERFSIAYEALIDSKLIGTKKQLAEIIGTHGHIIGYICKGERNPTMDHLRRMVNYFNLDANFFFGKSESLFLNNKVNEIEDSNDIGILIQMVMVDIETVLDKDHVIKKSSSYKKLMAIYSKA